MTRFRDTELFARIVAKSGRDLDVKGVHKYGFNAAIVAVEETVWTPGGVQTWLTTAAAVRVKAGGDGADVDSTGAGMRTLTVQGLNATGAECTADIVLKGATVSDPTTVEFLRVFRAFGLTSGTAAGANTGIIIIETTGGTVMANIAATKGQTQMASYTIPLGYTGYVTHLSVTANVVQTLSAKLYQRGSILASAAPFGCRRVAWEATGIDGAIEVDFPVPLEFPELTDMWVAATGPAGSAAVTADFDIWLVKS